MKNLQIFAIFLTILIVDINCRTILKREIGEPYPHGEHPHQKQFIESVKDKAEDIIENIKDKTVGVVQHLKTGYQKAKCEIHKVGEKVYHHTHDHNPCDGVSQGPNNYVEIQPEDYVNPHNQHGSYGGSNNQQGSYGDSHNQPENVGGSHNQQGSYGGSHNQPENVGGSHNQQGSYGVSHNQPENVGGANNQPDVRQEVGGVYQERRVLNEGSGVSEAKPDIDIRHD